MIVAGEYSFNGGGEYIRTNFPKLLTEIVSCIRAIDKASCKTKISEERTMPGRVLYSPADLNQRFKEILLPGGWRSRKQNCEYSTKFYTREYLNTNPPPLNKGAFRDMDFEKNGLGVEVQFGKYSFMVYNVCAKMTIFRKLNIIRAGIEVVPIKRLADEMSSGVSYFEQFVWDLEARGVSDIDTPVLILGIA